MKHFFVVIGLLLCVARSLPRGYAAGVYFSGTGSIVPSRYSFADSSGNSNGTNSLNLDCIAVTHPSKYSLVNVQASTEKKTIITPFRETNLGVRYSRSNAELFKRMIQWDCGLTARSYEDIQNNLFDSKGFGVSSNALWMLNDRMKVSGRYYLAQRAVRDSQQGFWNHLCTVRHIFAISRDIQLTSGIDYIRNDAKSPVNDFKENQLLVKYKQTVSWNHTYEIGLKGDYLNYQNNPLLDKDAVKWTMLYSIPRADITHELHFNLDTRYFPRATANSFQEMQIAYKQQQQPDIRLGQNQHNARVSSVTGKAGINDYWDGCWEYRHETPARENHSFYIDNSFCGRFWSNKKITVPAYQHYLQDELGIGITLSQRSNGMVQVGPLIGTRQTINPYAHQNNAPDDNTIVKNPYATLMYGMNARSHFQLNPDLFMRLLLTYKNFVNYNDHTGTECIDFGLDITQKIASRLQAVFNLAYSQNVNNVAVGALDNNLLTVMLKLEYVFDMVL